MAHHLFYTGQWLYWFTEKNIAAAYRATSGLLDEDGTDYRYARNQCVKNAGPIPNGKYSLLLKYDPKVYARDDGTNRCNLRASQLIQKIPRSGDTDEEPSGGKANACEDYWANWGWNRVRLEPVGTTRTVCKPRRGGFYIHDSTKGYTHGCIEVDTTFFHRLQEYVKKTKEKTMYFFVEYTTKSTYGSTRK